MSWCTDGGVIFSDYRTMWVKYCFSTPLLESRFVYVKFAAKLLTLAAALILSIVYLAVLGIVNGSEITLYEFQNLLILFFWAAVFSSIYLTLSIKYKDRNAASVRLVGVFAALYIPAMAYAVNLMSRAENDDVLDSVVLEGFGNIRNILFLLSPVLAAVSVIAGCILSIRSMQRREN